MRFMIGESEHLKIPTDKLLTYANEVLGSGLIPNYSRAIIGGLNETVDYTSFVEDSFIIVIGGEIEIRDSDLVVELVTRENVEVFGGHVAHICQCDSFEEYQEAILGIADVFACFGGYESYEEYLEDLKRKEQEKEKQKLKECLSRTVHRQKDAIARDIESLTHTANDLKSRLRTCFNDINRYRIKLIGYEKAIPELEEKLEREIELVLSLPEVANVKAGNTEGEILIETKPLMASADDGSGFVRIGELILKVNPNYNSVHIFAKDKKDTRKSWGGLECPHPHVNSSGVPCWGNVATSVVELIANNEWYALTTVVLGYLKSINMEDESGDQAIKHWDWFELTPEGEFKEIEREPVGDLEYCVACDCSVDIDHDDYIRLGNGDLFCLGCAEEYLVPCDYCEGEYVDTENAPYSLSVADGTMYFCCEEHMQEWKEENGEYCQYCGKWEEHYVLEQEWYNDEYCSKECFEADGNRVCASCEQLIDGDAVEYATQEGDILEFCCVGCLELYEATHNTIEGSDS